MTDVLETCQLTAVFALGLASCLLIMQASRWGSSPLYRGSDIASLALPWLATAILLAWLAMAGPRVP